MMTESFEGASILAPVSAEAPCGPDLETEGDAEFLNFMAAAEGQLPPSFFSFDRKSVDFVAVGAAGERLLARSHDVRLLVLLAKLAILNRDLDAFAQHFVVLARWLADQWEEVHPRADDGDFTVRIAQISTLDDGPVVVLPMQYAPLAETQRDGVLSFRAQLVATGEVGPRESENLPNAAAIDRILLNADLPRLTQTLRALQAIKSSIAQIRTILIERVGHEHSLDFEALSPLVDRMTAFVQEAVARRDPSVAAPAPAEPATSSVEGGRSVARTVAFASLADVDAALGAALAYFETMEPSSAAVLLIGQTRQLLGKNLYEVMKILTPTYADNARVFVGSEAAFTVPISNIAAANQEAAAPPAEQRAFAPAPTRAAALVLIENVAAHMRATEPSSPAPYLLDRAKALASRDFLSLLKDLLSEDALSNLKRGD